MRTVLLAGGISLVITATALAQGTAPPAAGGACYVELTRLMAEPPTGIGELGAAIRQLDTALRPQVEEIKVLKAQIARLERQTETVAQPGIEQASFDFDDTALAQPLPDDPAADELMRLQAELGIKQDRLKRDYAAQQQALVGPVQARINGGAQAFAAGSGCAEMKMARSGDIAELSGAGARNVTGEFVAWYLANPPG